MSCDRNLRLADELDRVHRAWRDFLTWVSNAPSDSARGYGQIVAHDDRAAYKLLGSSFALIANPIVHGSAVVLEVWLANPKPKSTDIGPWFFDGGRAFHAHPGSTEPLLVGDEPTEAIAVLDFFSVAVLSSDVFRASTEKAADAPAC